MDQVLREGEPLTFKRLLELAPPDQRKRLAEQTERDAEVDAHAIRAWWRKTRGTQGSYTRRQGQFLAFIHAYTKLHGQPPAEADIASYFGVTPPSAHQMVVTLERHGFIVRQPGRPRSVHIRLHAAELPELE